VSEQDIPFRIDAGRRRPKKKKQREKESTPRSQRLGGAEVGSGAVVEVYSKLTEKTS